MIRLNKPNDGPTIPYSSTKYEGQCKLVNASTRCKEKYLELIQDYDSGEKSFNFDSSIYGHQIIRDELMIKVQKKRCCYCQKSIADDCSVEHFRPKDAFKQSMGNQDEKPGYYWLAYEWTNLFYACSTCNRHKSTLFPLGHPERRVRDHQTDPLCTGEDPIMIDLVNENPEDFITFTGTTPYGKQGDNFFRGKETIQILKLDRKGLMEERKELLNRIKTFKEALELCEDEDLINLKFKEHIREKAQPGKTFSLMVKCNYAEYLN